MIQKTKNYGQFKFREDNREGVHKPHVERLKQSINAKNMLEWTPILVNKDMEIIDGQHRLMAAKELGVDIYYKINEDMQANQMILLNISKSWTIGDYMNYYCKNDYKEYQKLKEFMHRNNISLKVAMNITVGSSLKDMQNFKLGNYVFKQDIFADSLDICWDTINYIKKMNGHSSYTLSVRFWKALIKLVRHESFSPDRWMGNLSRMHYRFGSKASVEDYLKLMMEVHNWRNEMKVILE
jgi:ParB-like nuclease family protein